MADPVINKKQNNTKVIDSKRNTKKPKIAAAITYRLASQAAPLLTIA